MLTDISIIRMSSISLTFFLLAFLCLSPAYGQSPAWLPQVQYEEEFFTISLRESSRSDMLAATKFLAPVTLSDSVLNTVYQNVNTYRLHIDFMRQEFPQYFAGLTSEEYLDLVYYRASRTYFAGVIYQFMSREGQIVYGFNTYHAPGEELTVEEAAALYRRLSETFHLKKFAYSPITQKEIDVARQWKDPGFPVYFPEGIIEPEYEAYSLRSNYGRIRLLTVAELEAALVEGLIGWQDIVVVDQAPTDIEAVVAGIITGTRQGELSHVNVRALRRGTPNAYLQNPLQNLKPYENQLVKLTLAREGYQVQTDVTLTEAEVWWTEHRPSIQPLPQADDVTSGFLYVNAVRQTNLVPTYGGKAGQLATLYKFLDPKHQVKGFAIPFHYYQEFMRSNTIPHPQNPSTFVSYEEYIHLLMQDERFRSDSAYRRLQLENFVEFARDEGTVDPQWVTQILGDITRIYGSSSIRVRFRSSSNAEDNLQFNGAGLYESTTVCPDDNLDSDNQGPSTCDPNEEKEKTIERGLKKVWTSLWSPKAFDEREYYQIDHKKARMGVLVTQAFPDEDANGVAFSGDPITGVKYNYLVNVQKGDESVVQPGTGIVPEKDLVSVYPGGGFVQRIRPSSLVTNGEWVLSDEQLIELGTVLQQIDEQMPLPDHRYMRRDILMDIEFKFDDGQLFIKQVRPLLSPTAQPIVELPEVKLIVPQNTRMGSVFEDGRSLQDEYKVLSLLHLKAGEYVLPTQASELEMNLIDHIEYTPQRIVLQPVSIGRMTIEIWGEEIKNIQFNYYQTFQLPDGRKLNLTLSNLRFEYNPDSTEMPDMILTEDFLASQFIYASGVPEDGQYEDQMRFASLTYKTLSLYKHTFDLTDGSRLELYRRYQPPFAGSSPARLVYAIVDYQGQTVSQSDPWKLVYAAVHHNWDEKFRVLFDTPIGVAYGMDVETFTFDAKKPVVYLLDANLNRIGEIEVGKFSTEEVDDLPGTPVKEWLHY